MLHICRGRRSMVVAVIASLACILMPHQSMAQQGPVNGMRPADLRTHAIVDARVVVAPGEVLERATIVVRRGVIEAVGTDLELPAEAWVWPGDGLTVYAGLIDPAVLVDAVNKRDNSTGAHWNNRVRPEVNMIDQPAPSAELRRELRSLGFTAAAVYPSQGVFRGSGSVLALAEEDEHVFSYRDRAAMSAALDYGRGWSGDSYPGSLMGAIALVRQTLFDAQWHAEARRVYAQNPQGHEPPIRADALVALAEVVAGRQAVLFDCDDELNALRAGKIAEEFNLDMILLGSGLEFRRLSSIAALNMPVIVPLKFPDRPNVNTLASAERVSLRELQTWEQAPTNARRLIDAGVTVALTTHRLDRRSAFPAAVREAMKHGLSEVDALASLTTVPAQLLGIDQIAGTIEPGKLANFVVVKGDLFDKDATIRDTWINGRRYEISRDPDITFVGTGVLRIDDAFELNIELDTTKSEATVKLAEDESSKARNVTVQRDHVSLVIDGALLETTGYVRLSGVISGGIITGSGAMADGSRFTFIIEPEEIDHEQAEDVDHDQPEDGDDEKAEQDTFEMPRELLAYPLGAYGVTEPPRRQDVLIRGATIWTSGPKGIIEDGDLYIKDGLIEYVGSTVSWTWGANDEPRIIKAGGKHITPGLIDCHSHTGISGRVNEWTQVNTAEVRIADVIDPDSVHWYRQLAGGLTAANQLHGSANPIGGQNSVVKLKWGVATPDEMLIDDAIAGIKFALGENVVRTQTRYPNTRMGVETVLRDAFTAASEYEARRNNANNAMPVRRDLTLDALVSVLNGDMLVHCHSYRQDEILMLIRVAEDFGFTVGTFQHVLEGYKVAEAIAAHQRDTHGAGASAFSDWWGYKVEVQDAIPHAGALMHQVGVNVSFNSDSSDVARRMNAEAAKAVRYGGVSPEEALKFVTINPAMQLRIDHRTGSLEVGKDADFVLWSGDPLSTYTRAEQTWIEGALYFDLETDLLLRAETETERQRLIQKILIAQHGDNDKPKKDEAADQQQAEPAGVAQGQTRLMHRLMENRRRVMQEQYRLGRDPEEIRPGECGCNDWWYELR